MEFKNSFRVFTIPFELLSYSNMNIEDGDEWANINEKEARDLFLLANPTTCPLLN